MQDGFLSERKISFCIEVYEKKEKNIPNENYKPLLGLTPYILRFGTFISDRN